MYNTLAIAKKELRIYFTTATSYALMTCFAFITAFFFLEFVAIYQLQSTQAMQFQQPQMLERMNFNDSVITPLFGNVQVFFLFMIPMLTMRLLAEEKRTKTMQLLMTAPLRPFEIVMGKYLAASVLTLLMLVITMAFPLLLTIYGSGDGGKAPLDWASVGTGYLGMFLVGVTFVSIGLFASSVTESQIVAVVISFAMLLMFWVIGWAGIGKEGFWHDLTNYVSLLSHLEGFSRGLIRVQDVIYYVSMIVLWLFLTHRTVEAQRWR